MQRGIMQSPELGARSIRGSLDLLFSGGGGRTVLRAAVRTPPLHVQRLLYLDREHPALAQAVLINTTAGLFAGDQLGVRVRLAEGAAATLTSPTMTRVFGTPDGCAEVSTVISVGAGCYLEFLPEATLLCRDARLLQRMELDADAEAAVALGEVLLFGRRAHGELHAYAALQQRTRIRRGGAPLISEGLSLAPSQCPTALGILGDFAAYGTLQVLVPDAGGRSFLADIRALLTSDEHVWAAASLLADGKSVGVRALGHAAHPIQRLLRVAIEEFRRRYCPRLDHMP